MNRQIGRASSADRVSGRYCLRVLIGVIGDYAPQKRTHATLDDSLGHAGASWEWVATDQVPPAFDLERRYSGLWIAPASPYRSMSGALSAISTARERGLPLVGT